MLTKSIDIQDNHQKLTELLPMVSEGKEIILTEGKKPIARLMPFPTVADCSKLPVDGKKTRDIALARCDCLLDEYLRWKKDNMMKSNRWQVVALILTAITPVLVLLPWEFVNIIGAATAAGAAIATGILAIHGYRENFIRYGSVWHTLQTERYLYLTRARKEYWESDEETAARKFAGRIERLIVAEVNAWQAMMEDLEPQNPNEDLANPVLATGEE